MLISRRDIFKMAWKKAKTQGATYRNLRTAFAAALRSVWELVKAAIAEEKRRPAPVQSRPAPSWFNSNPYRVAAANRAKARLGSYCGGAW